MLSKICCPGLRDCGTIKWNNGEVGRASGLGDSEVSESLRNKGAWQGAGVRAQCNYEPEPAGKNKFGGALTARAETKIHNKQAGAPEEGPVSQARAQQTHNKCRTQKSTARAWQKHGKSMAGAWQGHGKNMARAWQGTWQEHGRSMARAWQEHSTSMARAWQARAQPYHGNSKATARTRAPRKRITLRRSGTYTKFT